MRIILVIFACMLILVSCDSLPLALGDTSGSIETPSTAVSDDTSELTPVQTSLATGELDFAETVEPSAYDQPSRLPHMVQAGTPVAVQNFVRPEAECNWSGIGGQVFNLDGAPEIGLVVEIRGTLEGANFRHIALTGSSMALGAGGFDIMLADHLVDSKGSIYLQLFDLSGNPLSREVYFDTYADCERNMVLINLKEVLKIIDFYFPLVFKN